MGEAVEIRLEENPTTGFRWDLDPQTEAGADVQLGERIAGGGALGAGGHRRILVRALTPGRHAVHLRLARSWNQEVNKTFELTLVARERPA